MSTTSSNIELDHLRDSLVRRQVVLGCTSYVAVSDILDVLREYGWDAEGDR